MDRPLYQISNWETHFEVAKSRAVKHKNVGSFPIKQDGLGYNRLVRRSEGAALYGCFIACVMVCHKQPLPRKGYLTDTGGAEGVPFDAIDLSIQTNMPAEAIEQMLTVCSSSEIGWIVKNPTKTQQNSHKGYHEDTAGIPQGYQEDTTGPLLINRSKVNLSKEKATTACEALSEESTLPEFIAAFKSITPSFGILNEMGIGNEFQSAPRKYWLPAFNDFQRDMLNTRPDGLPGNPAKLFGGYLRNAAKGKESSTGTPTAELDKFRQFSQTAQEA